ncbi:MAG: ribosome hibernation-promoting factor, HPF/YfiA family [Clostridium sp.]
MDIKIVSTKITITQAIEEYIEKKLERIQKYYDRDLDVSVTVKEEGQMKTVQFSINVGKVHLRTISEHPDFYAAVDKNIDVLERQIRKQKEQKLKNKEEVVNIEGEEEIVENEIIKYQAYELKPLDPEDAKMILSEHKTNNFFTFININTGKVNVVFKLKDGKNYGLVVPEQ